nr:hypothetical protein [Tanacetum cinerariifolium]
SFKTLCLLNCALMKRHDYDITVFFMKRGVTIMVSEPGYETVGSKDLTCEDWMVNTRTDADLLADVQNALQTLLPQIRAEIREEFRTSSGPSDSGGNPPPRGVTVCDGVCFEFSLRNRVLLRWCLVIKSLLWTVLIDSSLVVLTVLIEIIALETVLVVVLMSRLIKS